ncbi:MAG TPA: rhamnogalacturonan acetylesterase [Opitutaceae bacterium]|jgi:lysophospholipase L1-like esterase|nr:rhamnogalacturonan acetylesterase [Opitutaceae bacterium]
MLWLPSSHLKIVLTALVAVILAPIIGRAEAPRLILVGDSTVSTWPTSGARRGWGQYLQGYFKSEVSVSNLAASGRSTKTFIAEGRWQEALEMKGDFILIQFGHNDSHSPEKPEATSLPIFKNNLIRFIGEARAARAIPILVTPMCRRTFGTDGKLIDALLPYVQAMKEVAAVRAVGLIDLHASSRRLFESLGESGSAGLADVPSDTTHFNERGARTMAELVVIDLVHLEPSLKEYVRVMPVTVVGDSAKPSLEGTLKH